MPIEVTSKTFFQFSRAIGDTTYSFNIPAASHSEACQKLISALTMICDELKGMVKPGAN